MYMTKLYKQILSYLIYNQINFVFFESETSVGGSAVMFSLGYNDKKYAFSIYDIDDEDDYVVINFNYSIVKKFIIDAPYQSVFTYLDSLIKIVKEGK